MNFPWNNGQHKSIQNTYTFETASQVASLSDTVTWRMGMGDCVSKFELKANVKENSSMEEKLSYGESDEVNEKAKSFDFIRFMLCDIQGISR